ncbi:MAG: hypothetical protein EHM42_13715 [Planctomycetaceae bacterium]|nr:MAG: hypothetical protein EHM42_13715 [Planctomycetaceae bacterium]
MQPSLIEFIRHARSRGMDAATVRVMLGAAGWKDRDVATALAQESLELPIPEPRSGGGPQELFRYLLCFVTLYILLVNLVLLYFGYLDRLLPDPAEVEGRIVDPDQRFSALRWSLAMVCVTFPVYFGLSRSIVNEVVAAPEKTRSPARRFFTWLTVFIAAVTALFNGITLLYYFFEGELSPRFVLKVVILFFISAAVFIYHLLSLRLDERSAV